MMSQYRKRKKSLVKLIISLFILTSFNIFAAEQANLPPNERIDPARFPVENRQPLLPQTSTMRIKVPITAETTIPNAAKTTFTLKKVKLIGTDVVPLTEVEELYSDKINQKISIATLQSIVQQITVLYRNNGYVLSQAILPPQEIEKGMVVIRIIEGYIFNVKIEGQCNKFTKWILQKYGEHIQNEKPLHIDTLERYALLANELPGVKVRTLLKPAKNKQGATDLVFVVDRNISSLSFVVDNRGTELLGPTRMIASFQMNETLPGGKTGIRLLRTKDFDEVKYNEFFHEQLVNTRGLKLNIEYGKTKSKPDLTEQGVPDNINSKGTSIRFNTGLSYPIIRTRKQNLKGMFSFRVTTSSNRINEGLTFKDNIRAMQIGAVYDRADSWGANVVSVTLDQGLDVFDASNADPSRAGFSKTFTKVEGSLTRYQRIYGPVGLLVSGAGQYSYSELPSLEEFGVGGSVFGLAYDSSEITGDHGIAWKVDLQMLVPTKGMTNIFVVPPTVFIYVDGGKVWNINASQQDEPDNLVSMGGGFKMKATKYFDLSLVITKPVNKRRSVGNDRKVRAFFSIMASI